MKKCSKCKITKPETDFYKSYAECKLCHNKRSREYRKKNWDKILPLMVARTREWNKKNPEKVKEYRRISNKRASEKLKQYKISHPEKYFLFPSGKYFAHAPLTAEEKRIHNIATNAKYQKGKGHEAHKKAARESARRKKLENKQNDRTSNS